MDGSNEELCAAEFACYSAEYFSILIYHVIVHECSVFVLVM